MSFATIFTADRAETAVTISIALIITGFFTHDFLPILSTIGVLATALTACLYFTAHQKIFQKRQWRVYMALVGVFILHLLSGFNTSLTNSEKFWVDVWLQLPFLLLPLSFWVLPPLTAHSLRRLYRLFYYLVVGSAIGSTGYYLLHTTEINQLYYQSQIMPTIPDYIRFSLMVTFAIVIGCLTLADQAASGCERLIGLLTIGFLILYLYLLAVRSGLVAFNVLGLLLIVWLIIKQQRYKWAVGIGGMLIVLPLVAFMCFPTFHNKYYNTQDDLSRVAQTSSANNFSLVGRVYSYKVGLQIAYAHPWFGVGKADMEDEVAVYYRADFPDIRPSAYLLPHNQFLYNLVAFGGVGLVFFVGCLYYPLFWGWPRVPPLLLAQYLIISLSFLVEYTLDQEAQIGLLFTLLFLLLPLSGQMPDRH